MTTPEIRPMPLNQQRDLWDRSVRASMTRTRSEYDANRYMAATSCDQYRPAIPLAYQRDRINWRAVAWLLVACAVAGWLL